MNPIVHRFIEDAGNLTQSLGLGRVPGQIFAYLYFSPEPRNLGDMQEALGISKGSASTMVRLLEQWGAVRKVWVKGDRKDYYQAGDWFGRIIKNAVADTVGKRVSTLSALMTELEQELSQIENGDEHGKFVRSRFQRIRQLQKRAQDFWESPVLQMMMR